MPGALLIAILLTALAGYVDAIGYLTFAKIYTANMSGNSVAVGIGLGGANWPQFAERIWPVALYVVGIFAGRILIEVGGRKKVRRIASVGFALEIILIGLTITTADSKVASVALLACAMGLQNAILTHFSSLTVHTGFVTGTLVRMSEELVRYGAWLWDGGKLAQSPGQTCFRTGCALLLVWCGYVAGAALGAIALWRFSIPALVAAVVLLVVFIAIDLRSPLAVQEEKAQVDQH